MLSSVYSDSFSAIICGWLVVINKYNSLIGWFYTGIKENINNEALIRVLAHLFSVCFE
jgi:hypothetical protein